MTAYEQNILELRRQEEEDTRNDPLHWLYLTGLFWLEEGENPFGNDEANKIHIPSLPHPFCGKFILKDKKVTLHPERGVEFSFDDRNPGNSSLRTDKDPNPDLIHVGSIAIKIIVRGDVILARAWDREHPNGKNFAGYKYYPVNPEYRVTAKYIRYDPPKPTIQLESIGTEIESFFMGEARFKLNGEDCVLIAEKRGERILFNFRDATNSDTTYGGGRKFYMNPPKGDEIILDFNVAENWPCAYTPFATCPIPPKENRLPIRVEAGELKYFDY